jgi:hypothetical protein
MVRTPTRIDAGREEARANHTLRGHEAPKPLSKIERTPSSPFLVGDALKNPPENVSADSHPSWSSAALSVFGAFRCAPAVAAGIELLKMRLQAGKKIPDVAVELREITDCVQHLIESGLI